MQTARVDDRRPSGWLSPKRGLLPLLACLLLAMLLGASARAQLPPPSSAPAARSARTALVIGNGRYLVGGLENPANDATDIKAKLEALQFQVVLAVDADRRGMTEALKRFKRLLQASPGLALFYFAGHGMQVNGNNYLLPVDANITDVLDVEEQTIGADEVLRAMEDGHDGDNLLLLDACRNNPFEQAMRSSTRSIPERGLAFLNAPSGTLFAYATAPGAVAYDGDAAERNGVYTKALLRYLDLPGLDVERVLRKVGAAVEEATQGRQKPWVAHSLRHDVVLVAGTGASGRDLLNLARSNYQRGDFLAAMGDIDQALVSERDQLGPTERDEALKLRALADQQLAVVQLAVVPASASVRVDGTTRYSVDGKLPLNPGPHRLQISQRGYRPLDRSIVLESGRLQVIGARLTPHRARWDAPRWLAWSTGALGVGTLASALPLWLRARALERALYGRCGPDRLCPPRGATQGDWRSERTRALRLTRASQAMLGIGSAAAAAAVVFALLGRGEREPQRSALLDGTVACTREGCTGAGSLRF